MKRELVNIITGVGLTLLAGAVVLLLLTALLFMFPDLSLFGAKSVNERDSQVVYRDPALTDAFANGRFIIESTGAQIEVKMSNTGYEGEGTIVVNETATGIAFNSLNRTLIEWTQTLYEGETFCRIKVLEPSGLVFSDKPTTIYINLPHRKVADSFRHDFVLQSTYSNVNFSFVDNTAGSSDALRIGNLVVESAATVNIPSSPNISLQNIELKSEATKIVCQSKVLGNVDVLGPSGEQTFNASIGGKVTIKGEGNNFTGDTAGDVVFSSANGSLTMNKVKNLNINTVNAGFNIDTVTNGVVMQTMYGNLNVNKIENNGLQFTAGVKDNPNATASVSVNSLVGDVKIKNYGIGGIYLTDVDGDVDIESSQVGGGNIDVTFQNDAEDCSVKVLGYDGNINIQNINGQTNIEVLNWKNGAGAANVNVSFNKIVGFDNEIKTGGYISGHHDWGNVDIQINDGCNGFDLYVYGASSANSESKYGFDKNNMYIIGDNAPESPNKVGLISSGAVKVRSKQSVYLR